MGWLALPLFVVFFGVGYKLTLKAYGYLRDPRRPYGFTPIFRPEQFLPEGEQARKRAALYWRVGSAVFLLALILLDLLTG